MKIGFALITEKTFMQKIINLEHRVHKSAGFFDTLGETANLPHTTIFQGDMVDNIDYQKIALDLSEKFVQLFPNMSIKFRTITYVPEGWYFLECEKTENFSLLHNYLLKKVEPYIILSPNRLNRKTENLTPHQYEAIDKYGYRYSDKAFYPHITIGRSKGKDDILLSQLNSAMENIGYAAHISKITVYKMGNNGTHEKTLYEITL